MTFADALRSCFDRWLTFSGRAPRPEFWWFVLFWALSYVTIAVVGGLSFGPGVTAALLTVFALAMFLPMLAVSFRRLQDTGRSGWFAATPVIGAAVASFGRLIGDGVVEFAGICMQLGISLVLIFWYAAEGTSGPNAFGPDPMGRRPRH